MNLSPGRCGGSWSIKVISIAASFQGTTACNPSPMAKVPCSKRNMLKSSLIMGQKSSAAEIVSGILKDQVRPWGHLSSSSLTRSCQRRTKGDEGSERLFVVENIPFPTTESCRNFTRCWWSERSGNAVAFHRLSSVGMGYSGRDRSPFRPRASMRRLSCRRGGLGACRGHSVREPPDLAMQNRLLHSIPHDRNPPTELGWLTASARRSNRAAACGATAVRWGE